MLGTERDALTFLKTKAKEARMYSLLSATLLNEAKLSLTMVRGSPSNEWIIGANINRAILYPEH
jgi:hypothetical protein